MADQTKKTTTTGTNKAPQASGKTIEQVAAEQKAAQAGAVQDAGTSAEDLAAQLAAAQKKIAEIAEAAALREKELADKAQKAIAEAEELKKQSDKALTVDGGKADLSAAIKAAVDTALANQANDVERLKEQFAADRKEIEERLKQRPAKTEAEIKTAIYGPGYVTVEKANGDTETFTRITWSLLSDADRQKYRIAKPDDQ